MFRIAGTKGTLWSEGDAVWLADADGERQLRVPPDLMLPPPPDSLLQDANHRYTHVQIGQYTRLCETFRSAIEGRRPTSPVSPPTFEDGVKCIEVLDAIRKSAARGGALTSV